jgi:hypothetical protein
MEASEQVRREVCSRLWVKGRAPPAREAVTLMMRLLRGLVLSAFGPAAVDGGGGGGGDSGEPAKRQKLVDLGEAERRWQAVFPDEPGLTTSLNEPPKRVVCPKPLVDAVSVGAFRPQPHLCPGVCRGYNCACVCVLQSCGTAA